MAIGVVVVVVAVVVVVVAIAVVDNIVVDIGRYFPEVVFKFK